VVVVDDLARVEGLGGALKRGGLPLAEVTLRTGEAIDALRMLALDADLIVGAGTVVRPEQVDAAQAAGAKFAVMPGFNRRVVDRCRELEMPVIPGVCTPSEVIAALESGIELMKFFPAEASGGTEMLRALSAPFPEIRLIPTGGVNSENAATYLRLPEVAAVGGSWMVARELLRDGDFASIARLSAEAVKIVGEARG
jgi:2-dehydro-3-deoxyphosphogluconate aldolase/(4S)-4-hydroxy-2-oxoglutarate aldolase